jgi:hypothetical protein
MRLPFSALLAVAVAVAVAAPLAAQELAVPADAVSKSPHATQDSVREKYFVGSTLFMLANVVPDNNPPNLAYLNVGYRLTKRDIISLELKTWKYGWPIGIPYGKSFEAEGEGFPGYVREYGVSVNYQRFLAHGLFAQVDVMPAFQSFVNERGSKIDNGFQIFNTYSVGYRVKFFKDRVFFDPSLAITHRPYQSTMPAAFKQVDDRWSRFFYGQPGLHFGYNF